MKKLYVLLLTLTLAFAAFALSSCDNDGGNGGGSRGGNEIAELNGKTPDEIYEAAVDSLSNAAEFEVTTSQVITMTVSYGGQSQSVEMTQEVSAKVDGDNTYTKVSSDNAYASMNMEAWYVDGVVYANSDGTKLKTNLTKEQYMEQYMNADPSESTLLDIPKSWFEDVRFKEIDGEYKIEFDISGEKYNELLENLGLDIVQVDGNVKYSVYFDDDGNLTHIITEFDMDSSAMGANVDAHCVSTSIIKLKNVTVTAPEDADSYQLVANP